jgi:hypothetical protein
MAVSSCLEPVWTQRAAEKQRTTEKQPIQVPTIMMANSITEIHRGIQEIQGERLAVHKITVLVAARHALPLLKLTADIGATF